VVCGVCVCVCVCGVCVCVCVCVCGGVCVWCECVTALTLNVVSANC